jgi:hypothetical protein
MWHLQRFRTRKSCLRCENLILTICQMPVPLMQWQWGDLDQWDSNMLLGALSTSSSDISRAESNHGIWIQNWEQLQKARGSRTTLVSLYFTCVSVSKSRGCVLPVQNISVHLFGIKWTLKTTRRNLICVTNSFIIHNGSNSSAIKNLSVSFKVIARITLHAHYINATPLNNKQPSHTTDLTAPVKCLCLCTATREYIHNFTFNACVLQ